MARINIENDLFIDHRFTKLVLALGSADHALGALARTWIVAQQYWIQNRHGIPKAAWKAQELSDRVIEVGLAEDRGDFVFVIGSEKHFAWLTQKQEAGKNGGIESGKARREKTKKKTKRKEAEQSEMNRLEPSSSSSSSFSFSSSGSSSISEEKKDCDGVAQSAPPVTPTGAVWEAYRKAFVARHKVEPTRNGPVNGMLANFVKRVGILDAPFVAEFYVRHNAAYYVSKKHSVGPMLADAEALRTQWLQGRATLPSEARDVERSQKNADVWQDAAAILNARRDDQNETTPRR